MRMSAILGLAGLPVWAAGCVSYNTAASGCDGVACSGHGRCVERADGPTIVDIATSIEAPAPEGGCP